MTVCCAPLGAPLRKFFRDPFGRSVMISPNPTQAKSDATGSEAPLWRNLATALGAVALLVGYQVIVHRLIDDGGHPLATVFLGLVPIALVLTMLVRSVGWRVDAWWLTLAIAAGGWLSRDRLQAHIGWIYLVDHVGTQCLLSLMFAHTLRRGHTPLITQFALRVHAGVLSAEQFVYTRHATLAWSAFFALVAIASGVLFAWAPLPVWSSFANLLTLPLVAAMFIGEYAVRRLALPHEPHVSIAAGARAFWASRQSADRSNASGQPQRCPR